MASSLLFEQALLIPNSGQFHAGLELHNYILTSSREQCYCSQYCSPPFNISAFFILPLLYCSQTFVSFRVVVIVVNNGAVWRDEGNKSWIRLSLVFFWLLLSWIVVFVYSELTRKYFF